MQGPRLLSRTFLSAKLRKQFTCKWVCHSVWTRRIILKPCCERTNFQISACGSQSDCCAVAGCIHPRDLWPVFVVLLSTEHPFCTLDVYAGDSVGEKVAWKCSSPASELACPSVPLQNCDQIDGCGSWEKKPGQQQQFVQEPSPAVAHGLLLHEAGGAAAELASCHRAGCSSLFPDASPH